jgi:hypothetical protein
LYACSVDCSSNQSAKRIDLANQMSLRRAANGWIARHVRHGVSSERADTHTATDPGGRPRSLNASMPGTDHDDI